jgi:hypothetical protein
MNEEKRKAMEKAQAEWDILNAPPPQTEEEQEEELEAIEESVVEFTKNMELGDRDYLTDIICERTGKNSDKRGVKIWVNLIMDALLISKEKPALLRELGEALGVLKAAQANTGFAPAQFQYRKSKK